MQIRYFPYLIATKIATMKKYLLFTLLSFCFLFTQAQSNEIVYTDYGQGLRVPINANLPMDLDNDGTIDFYINGYENELGFSALFGIGCFASPSESAYTSFDARELSIFTEGETIALDGLNLFSYIDDGRGSIYHGDGVFADQWEDGVDQYIGFALVGQGTKDGWMRVAVDQEENQMIIYEIAYKLQNPLNPEDIGIQAGDSGVSSVADLGIDLIEFSVGPNPVMDYLQISFSYQGETPLSVIVVDAVGREVYRSFSTFKSGTHSLELQTSDWSSGMYFLQLSNEKGINTHKLNVNK